MKLLSPFRKDETVKKNLKTVIYAQSTGLVLSRILFQGGILSLLILKMEGNNFQVGILFSMFTGLYLLRVFVGPYIDIHNKKKLLFTFWLIGAVISILYIFVVPIYNSFGRISALIYLFSITVLYRVLINIGDAAWIPLMGEIIPENIKGRFWSIHRLSWQVVIFIIFLLVGLYLGKDPSFDQFLVVIIFAVTTHLIRPFLIKRIIYTPVVKQKNDRNIFQNIAEPLKNRSFTSFILYTICSTSAFYVIEPFMVPFLKYGLNIPTSFTIYTASGIHIGAIISLFFWGKISDAHGNRFVFFITNFFTFLLVFITLFIPEYTTSPFISVLAGFTVCILYGIVFSGFRIAGISRIISEAPPEEKGVYTNIWVAIWGLTSFVTPAVTGKILEFCEGFQKQVLFFSISNYKLVFAASSILLILSLYMLKKMKTISEKGIKEIIANFINYPLDRV